MRKPDPGAIDERDIARMARETGAPPPPEYLNDLLEKAKEIDREKALGKERAQTKAREKSKGKDKGRDMLDDD